MEKRPEYIEGFVRTVPLKTMAAQSMKLNPKSHLKTSETEGLLKRYDSLRKSYVNQFSELEQLIAKFNQLTISNKEDH